MKKLVKAVVVVILLIAFSNSANSQKIAYFSSAEVLKDYAPLKKIDTAANEFVKTLQAGYSYLKDEYEDKLGKLKDSAKMAPTKLQLLKEDVTNLAQKINNYQNDANNQLTEKKKELLAPIIKKINDEVEKYAKEQKCDFVVDISSTPLFFADKKYDISNIIKGKLK